MSPIDIDVGVDVDVIDEPQPAAAPTQTDTCFLVHTLSQPASPDDVVTELTHIGQASEVFVGEAELLANTDAFFNEAGGGRVYVVPLTDGSFAAALGLIQPAHGPGQVVAPEVVTAPELNTGAEFGWDTNRIYIPNGPDGATDAALTALKDAVIAGRGGRNAEIEADTLLIPGIASGQTREVSASIVKAALIARSDIESGNPNLAAAGVNGECRYVTGIKAERAVAAQQALAREQINCFRTVNNRIRAYGYWTLADLDELPDWWDLSGSRTMMAARALEQAVAEEHMFGQIDGERVYLDGYQGALRGELAKLQRLGALYATRESPGYRVDTSAVVNPIERLAQGLVTAQIVLRTSPFAASLKVNIVRRAITREV